MESIAVLTQTTVQDFWSSLNPGTEAQLPWLYYARPGERVSWSTKDIFAQAHCIAAFLVARGLRPGDRVVIIMREDPVYLSIDLGLQFAGAVNVTLPESMPPGDLVWTALDIRPRFIFTDIPHELSQHPDFHELRSSIDALVIKADDPGDLSPEKLVTLERAVTLGKADWRERQAEITAVKRSRKAEDLYSLLVDPSDEGRYEPVSYAALFECLSTAAGSFPDPKSQNLLAVGSPASLWRRVAGYFHPMASKAYTWSGTAAWLSLPIQLKPLPGTLFLAPGVLGRLYHEIAHKHFGKDARPGPKFTKALEIAQKRREYLEKGMKLPLALRTRHSLTCKPVYARVRKLFGGKLKHILVDKGNIPEEVRNFFGDAGFIIIQP